METDPSPNPPPNPPTPPAPDDSVKQWLIAIHLSPLVGLVIPFATIIAPLVIWLMKRDSNPALDAGGKAALNFQISIAIYFIVSALLALVFIGFLLMLVLFVIWIYGIVMAAVKASNGETFSYPVTIAFLK